MTLFLIIWGALALTIALVAVAFKRPPSRPTDPAVRKAWSEQVERGLAS